MKAITAGGGVVFRPDGEDIGFKVLLIYRRGVWDLPKGKLEENESITECAIREVAEETGVQASLQIISRLTDTYHEYEQDGNSYAKTTHWFAMKFVGVSKVKFDPQIEEDIEQVEWFSLSEAKKAVGYKNLLNVLESFEKVIGKG